MGVFWWLIVLRKKFGTCWSSNSLDSFVRLTACAVAETMGLPLHIHSQLMSFRKKKKKNHKKSNQQKKPKTQPTLLACFLHHLSSIKKDKRGGTSKKIWVFDSKRTLLLTKVTAYSLKANCTFLLLAISFWCWNTVSCFFQDNTYRTYRLKIIISQIALYIWVLIQCRDAYSTQTEVKVKGFKKRKYSVLYYMSSGFS